MQITGIIAIAQNFAIGREGKLPWHYPADLKFFRETTSGNAIVMGHKTWKAIGKALPKRLNVVLSRAHSTEPQPGVLCARSTEEIMALANFLNGDLFIIGGAQTYKNFADVIERWIVTEIPETVDDADAFMPADFLDGFEIKSTIELDDKLKVKIYERKKI